MGGWLYPMRAGGVIIVYCERRVTGGDIDVSRRGETTEGGGGEGG